MSHKDIGTLVEAVKIIDKIGGEVIVAPFEETLEPPGDVVEFCIGGPDANERTQSILDNFLVGVRMYLYKDKVQGRRLAINTKTKLYKYNKGKEEFAILAKFMPKPNSKPVFLIAGQTGFANRGAMYYLAQNYDSSLRRKYKLGPFCMITKVISPWDYGYKMVELVEDITATAFVK